MLHLPPDPDLPLRERLAVLRNGVPARELLEWGAGLARAEISEASSNYPPLEWIGGTRGWKPYWSRVWGLRLILHLPLSDEEAGVAAALLTGVLNDDEWRVREMALKVAAHHAIELDAERLVALLDDSAPRVRRQAERLLGLRRP